MNGLIFDIGFHTGRDTEFYLRKGFNVVAVEANPELAARGREVFADCIRLGRLKLVEAAIHHEAGFIDFFINKDRDEWSSAVESIGARTGNYHIIPVSTIAFAGLLKDYGIPYYLKIDIEGSDHLVLEALTPQSRPKYISVEATSLEIAAQLYGLGYRQFKLVNQALNFSYQCPNPPLEGEYVEAKFDNYSSGPFGEETPGDWLTFDELAWRYLRFASLNRDDGKVAWGWCDFHAKLTGNCK